MNKLVIWAAAAGFLINASAFAGETPSAPDAKVYFVNINDGDVVDGPVKVIFGLSGMGVTAAGLEKENTGHHHLFINRPPLGQWEDGADEVDYNIPADENHIHFGGGQTEVMLDLPAGEHTLQLVLADQDHIPHNPPVVSEVITITVN
ncbi:MAG: DUF4399 domain-containing protein [Pseudomonadota bacterium]